MLINDRFLVLGTSLSSVSVFCFLVFMDKLTSSVLEWKLFLEAQRYINHSKSLAQPLVARYDIYFVVRH